MTTRDQASRLRDAVETGFERTFGYPPTQAQVDRIVARIEDLPTPQRPNLQDVSGGGFRASWLAEAFPEYSQEGVDLTAEADGTSLATFRPDEARRADGTIITGRTTPEGDEILAQEMTDPATGQTGVVEFIELGNGIRVPLPNFPTEDEEDGPPAFIGGFGEDYVALPPAASSRVMRYANAERLRDQDPTLFADLTEPKPPRYRQGDHNSMFAGKDAAYIIEVQAAMVAAGFLDEEDAARERGVWSINSMKAMVDLMHVANADGSSWTQKARELARVASRAEDEDADGGGDPAAGRVYVKPVYREPDFATLSQSVKELYRQQLGRDPFDYEMALFGDQLKSDYRSAYEADVAAQMSEFEAGNHAIREADETEGTAIAGGGTIATVDPVARFLEAFEARQAGEIQLRDDRAESDETQLDIANLFSGINRMMGA